MESLRNEVFAYVLEQYGVEPDYPFPKDSNSGVLRHLNSQKWFAIVMPAPKKYLGTGADGHEDVITMKCDPMLIDSLIQRDGYYRAYHMNKQQWISIRLDGSVPMDKICNLVDFSFELTGKKSKKRAGQIRKMLQ